MAPLRTRRRSRAPRARLVLMLLPFVLLLAPVSGVMAASPGPVPTLLPPGDPRSEGEGPGGLEVPLTIALGVIVVGALAAGATLIFVRLTRDD